MIFNEHERSIFCFPSPDGQSTLYEDPLRIRRELLLASKNQLPKWLDEVKNQEQIDALPEGIKDQEILKNHELEAKIIEVGRKAFGCPPVDFRTGEGVTDAYVLETMKLYLDWMRQKKTNTES